jgi:DNA-binding MarR family transcriptional regulator
VSRSGADLALLLLGGFRALVDAAIVELARRGYEDVRPVHDFAMRAIAAGAGNASELGRRLSVSKQAAAKTIAVLQARGYVARDAAPGARRTRLGVTKLGFEVLRQGEAIFDELRDKWERQIGLRQLARLEAQLTALVGAAPVRIDTLGWMAQDHGEPVRSIVRKRAASRRTLPKHSRRR